MAAEDPPFPATGLFSLVLELSGREFEVQIHVSKAICEWLIAARPIPMWGHGFIWGRFLIDDARDTVLEDWKIVGKEALQLRNVT